MLIFSTSSSSVDLRNYIRQMQNAMRDEFRISHSHLWTSSRTASPLLRLSSCFDKHSANGCKACVSFGVQWRDDSALMIVVRESSGKI